MCVVSPWRRVRGLVRRRRRQLRGREPSIRGMLMGWETAGVGGERLLEGVEALGELPLVAVAHAGVDFGEGDAVVDPARAGAKVGMSPPEAAGAAVRRSAPDLLLSSPLLYCLMNLRK